MDNIADLLKARQTKKAPAYPWQDLALRIIQQLGVPAFKRSSVFKICKNLSSTQVERALNDTKELCKTGSAWQYFFKVADQYMPKAVAPIKTKKISTKVQ